MKKVFTLAFTLLTVLGVTSQIKTPAPSPAAKLTQTVGLTDVSVEYSRPAMKGRTIFGDLVPEGKLWRTGANKNTVITFSTDVTVGDKALKQGSYAIFTKPSQKSWDVYFYSDTNNWGTPRSWDDSKVAATLTVNTKKTAHAVESFSINVNDITDTGAMLDIAWANTLVQIPVTVPSDKMVMENIEKVMNGPAASDYYAAAVYYNTSGKDINKAREMMDKAMGLIEKPRFWQLRQQSLILAKAGDKKGAIKAAKSSLEGAKEAGNADYVKMNMDSLKEWGGL